MCTENDLQKFWHQTESQVLKMTHSHLSYLLASKRSFFVSYNLGEDKRNYCSTKNIPPKRETHRQSCLKFSNTIHQKKRSILKFKQQISIKNNKSKTTYQVPKTPKLGNLGWLKKSFEQKKKTSRNINLPAAIRYKIFPPPSTSVGFLEKRGHLSRIGLHQLRDAAEMSVVGRIV